MKQDSDDFGNLGSDLFPEEPEKEPEYVVQWGKYKGKTVEQVALEDPYYLTRFVPNSLSWQFKNHIRHVLGVLEFATPEVFCSCKMPADVIRVRSSYEGIETGGRVSYVPDTARFTCLDEEADFDHVDIPLGYRGLVEVKQNPGYLAKAVRPMLRASLGFHGRNTRENARKHINALMLDEQTLPEYGLF